MDNRTENQQQTVQQSHTVIDYKFNEPNLVNELQAYIDATYDEHYANGKYQATDMIIDAGHGTGFCIGNVLKYGKRYGTKGTPADQRKDLLKILHYAIIQLNVHDQDHGVEKIGPLTPGWRYNAIAL
jgi:hypothetical protein